MKLVEVLGLLLVTAIILLIDKPKLKTITDKTKCAAVYYAILAAVFLLGTLEIFDLLPTFNGMLVELYGKYSIK